MENLKEELRNKQQPDLDLASAAAKTAARFYFFHLPQESAESLAATIKDTFSRCGEDPADNLSETILAGMFSAGFRWKISPEDDLEFFNPNWSSDNPGVELDPMKVFNKLVVKGQNILAEPESAEAFYKWKSELESTLSSPAIDKL